MYGSMEESTPAAEAPALGPAEVKFVRKLMATSKTTTGGDDRPAGVLHEPQELSTSTLAKLEAASDEVELQASVWDASLFLFNPVAGRSASLFAFLLLLVNVFMQGSFAFYLIDGLDEKPLTNDDVNELKWWRRHVAHSLEFYNEEKGESLARRVCDGDYGVEGSGVQSTLHETLNDYLGDYFHPHRDGMYLCGINQCVGCTRQFFTKSFLGDDAAVLARSSGEEPASPRHRAGVYNIGVGPGGYLCMLAVCLWVITVCIDARRAFDKLVALRCLPQSSKSDIRVESAVDGTSRVVIAQISYARLVACVLVQLLRLVIGAALLWYGSLYLIHTIEINELILNAVALEFVLRIDDILFVCFVPTRIRALVKHAKPLRAPSSLQTQDGLDLRSVLSFLVCLCLVLVLYFTQLVPQKSRLEKAQHAMCGGDLDFVYAKDPMGAAWWAPTKKHRDDGLAAHNFPHGEKRSRLKDEDPSQPYEYFKDDGIGASDRAKDLSPFEFQIDVTLKQYGRPYFQDRCDVDSCFEPSTFGPDYPFYATRVSGCCFARLSRLSDPSLVRARASATFEDTVAMVNPAGVDIWHSREADVNGAGPAYQMGLSATLDDEPCRDKFPDGCSIATGTFCHVPTGECIWPSCDDIGHLCNAPNETGRLARALCSDKCGCEFPFSARALTDPRDGCSVDAAPTYFSHLQLIPCKDVSPEGDAYDAFVQDDIAADGVGRNNVTRWSRFRSFLDQWELANEDAPLLTKKQTDMDINYLRKYGCRYLRDPSLWDSLDSYEAWVADARSNLTVRPPYWLGRNLCVRGRGHKPLSLFCPEACGCHRGDEDCPLSCPERDATAPICPTHQVRTFVMPDKDAGDAGYGCPRRPQTHSFDVGFSAQDVREALSLPAPPPPPTNCAAANTGACLEVGGVDDDCCTGCGEGACASGYTYAGQFVFDKETLFSTYPDFNPICSIGPCGNTCCVPVGTNGTARAMAGG